MQSRKSPSFTPRSQFGGRIQGHTVNPKLLPAKYSPPKKRSAIHKKEENHYQMNEKKKDEAVVTVFQKKPGHQGSSPIKTSPTFARESN